VHTTESPIRPSPHLSRIICCLSGFAAQSMPHDHIIPAAAGGSMSLQDLEELTPSDPISVRAACDQMIQDHILIGTTAESSSIAIAHKLFSRTILDTLSPVTKVDLHRTLARWYALILVKTDPWSLLRLIFMLQESRRRHSRIRFALHAPRGAR